MARNQDNELIAYLQSLSAPNTVLRLFLDPGVRAKFAWEIWKARAKA
jgi:hypothetical protein